MSQINKIYKQQKILSLEIKNFSNVKREEKILFQIKFFYIQNGLGIKKQIIKNL